MVYACTNCGGTNVRVKVFIDANGPRTNPNPQDFTEVAPEDIRCYGCDEEETTLEVVEENAGGSHAEQRGR